MLTRPRPWRAFALGWLMVACVSSAVAETTADDETAAAYDAMDQKIVDLVRGGGSVEDIEKLGDEVVSEWSSRDPSLCAYLMRALADEVNYAKFDDQKKQIALERKLLRLAIDKSEGCKPHALVQLIERTIDELIEASREGRADDRNALAHLWLDTWQRVRDAIDPHWDAADVPKLIDVSQFSDIYANGMSPEAIEDPIARAKYVAACEENARVIRRRGEQIHARILEREFAPVVERAIVESYSALPVKESEMRAILEKYKIDPMTIDRMLKSIQEAPASK